MKFLRDVLDGKGRTHTWFGLEDRYIPLIDEGEAPPDADHYEAAERQTALVNECDDEASE